MNLLLGHANVANRSCELCQKFVFDEDTGQMTYGRNGEPEERLPGMPAPCRTRFGCAKGTPESPKSLTSENEMCVEHYRQCVAVGSFPDDPIVRRNAAIIKSVEDAFNRRRDREDRELLVELMLLKAQQ